MHSRTSPTASASSISLPPVPSSRPMKDTSRKGRRLRLCVEHYLIGYGWRVEHATRIAERWCTGQRVSRRDQTLCECAVIEFAL